MDSNIPTTNAERTAESHPTLRAWLDQHLQTYENGYGYLNVPWTAVRVTGSTESAATGSHRVSLNPAEVKEVRFLVESGTYASEASIDDKVTEFLGQVEQRLARVMTGVSKRDQSDRLSSSRSSLQRSGWNGNPFDSGSRVVEIDSDEEARAASTKRKGSFEWPADGSKRAKETSE